jgi:hypothetical protein
MKTQRKGRTGKDQAATNQTIKGIHFNVISQRLKALVIRAAIWGVIPVGMAQRLTGMGGDCDE